MNTCDKCKWWNISIDEILPNIHECLNPKNGLDRMGDEDGLYTPNECSVSGGWGIVPHAKFGCIHFEQKGNK